MLETRKIKLIASELMDYFFTHDILHLDIRINMTEEHSVITFCGFTDEQPDDFDEVLRKLNNPRKAEIEEYYEELLGLDDYKLELNIIAAMVDEADATFMNNRLILRVIRNMSLN